jgi:nucleoside-diphosphate-sugar epimerase
MKGKRVLVTGGSGFIASHLVERLVKEGADVTIMTRYDSVVKNIRLKHIWDSIHVMEADIRNVDSLQQVKKLKPEIVFHLAAYNHVGSSFTHVDEVYDVNAKGTANLLESYNDYECFVYTSTSEVYGLQDKVPFREDACPRPISPYAITKYAGELHARLHAHMGRPVVVLRPFNAFGPSQTTKAIIPELITNCLAGKPIRSTKGEQTREFNFVKDLVDGFILAAEKKPVGEIINIGGTTEISIHDLILKIAELTHTSSKIEIGALPYRPTEIWRMYADVSKAKRILGWEPKTKFDDSINQTIDWYRAQQ